MEVTLSSATPDRLTRVAAEQGRDSGIIAAEAIDRMLDYEEWFLKAVQEGIDAADRGELIDHEEVVSRMQRRFQA